MPLLRASRVATSCCFAVLFVMSACTSATPVVADDAPALPDLVEERAVDDGPVDMPPSQDVAPLHDVSSFDAAHDMTVGDMSTVTCPPGQVYCGKACIDTLSNNAHCGGCDSACAMGQTCRAGACDLEAMCTDGRMRCGDNCVDTSSSDLHCGACNNTCPASLRCVAGSCATPRPCAAGQTACGGVCVNTATDAMHCGACGSTCASGFTCMSGACRTPVLCTAGLIACGGTCVDLRADPNNCGACGEACRAGMTCNAGSCGELRCPPGRTVCGAACVDTSTNAAHCGGCARSCAPAQRCVAGMCTGATACDATQTRCGESCADLRVDPLHCGACGTRCAAGQRCVAGACRSARVECSVGQTDCTPTATEPTCINLATNASHCGACGVVCATGMRCEAGVCRCAAGLAACGRSCVATATDASNCGACGRRCSTGQVCAAGACGCSSGRTLCAGACVDTTSDVAHCGGCARTCSRSQSCIAGVCSCGAGLVSCGGSCVSTTTDRAHCGACGRACAEGQSCVGGACTCATGLTLCGGACVDLMTSRSNCGACGRQCPLAQGCVGARCLVVTPPPNDLRSGALVLDLAQPSLSVPVDTTQARHDTNGSCSCTSAGNDVFYRFTLTQPEIVYADTLGATWDTALFFQDAAGNNVAASNGAVACNDDVGSGPLCAGVGGTASMVAARLGAGTWYLVVSGCGAGTATLRVQHLAAGAGPSVRIAPSATVQTMMGATPSGAGTFSTTCCSGGAEASYFWVTCPGTPAATFHASTCGTEGTNTASFDVALAQLSALRPAATLSVCNDDVLGTCGQGASLNAPIPAALSAQAGLNALIVDACTGAGTWSVRYVLASCASGTRCGASCVDTASDATHCGGCDRRCSTGGICVGGVCQSPPSNDRPSGAVAIDLTRTASTYTVSTAAANNDTSGPCGCTSGRDVFYRFTLAQPELFYADTLGSSFDTSLFLQSSGGTAVSPLTLPTGSAVPHGTTCNDDEGLLGCATGQQSQVLAPLAAGEYRLVLSGCGAGNAVLHVQHVPIGGGTLRFAPPGSSVFSGTTTGIGRVNGACCSGGPEDTLYWYTCGAYRGGMFSASTCGRATWDTSLEQRSANRATTGVGICNDDACGTPLPRQSTLSSLIPAGAGLHALYIDGCGAGAGAYTVALSRP